MSKILYSKGLRIDPNDAENSLYKSVYDLKRDLILFDEIIFPNLDDTCLEIGRTFTGNGAHPAGVVIAELQLLKEKQIIRDYRFDKTDFSKIDINNLDNTENGKIALDGASIMMGQMTEMLSYCNRNEAEIVARLGQSEFDDRKWKIISALEEIKSVLVTKLINRYEENEIIDSKPVVIRHLNDNPRNLKLDPHNAYEFLLGKLPLPSDKTTWDVITDYKSDKVNQIRLGRFRSWIHKSLNDNITVNELKDEYEQLYEEFEYSINQHKIEKKYTDLKMYISAVPYPAYQVHIF